MLNVGCLVLDFFKLILRIPFKLVLDVNNKGMRILDVFLEEDFKIKPHNQSNILVATLILGLFEANNTTKESSYKRDTIYFSNV